MKIVLKSAVQRDSPSTLPLLRKIYPAGTVIEMPDDEATRLLNLGVAEAAPAPDNSE
jgi:hypothetical protein